MQMFNRAFTGNVPGSLPVHYLTPLFVRAVCFDELAVLTR